MTIKRCYPVLVGASVGENQLVNPTRVATGTVNDVTFTVNSDGSVTASGTASSDAYRSLAVNFGSPASGVINIPQNHVAFIKGCPSDGSADTYYLTVRFIGGSKKDVGSGYLLKINETVYNGALAICVKSGVTVNNVKFVPQCIDLTAELGTSIADYIYSLESATAGSGISKLREWGFLRGYQAYNAGSIESVEVTGKVVRGFNQWDEETESGSYNQNGEPTTDSTRIRTKNPIHVIPNTSYYFKSSFTLGVRWYDDQDNFISGIATSNVALLSPSNAYYLRFSIVNTTTYNHDICINLSSDRNGEYEPYTEQTYDYGSDTLRGIFKLDASNNLYADGDRKTADGIITRRYGTRAYQEGDESLSDAITDGTITVYKLLTPTTETSTPFTSPQIVYPDGTEEFITENGVPVGHETKYQL